MLETFYQMDVFGPAEFHKAIGGGYAVVIDHAERVTFVRIQLFLVLRGAYSMGTYLQG